ncbi:cytoplasmic tRNA 2-thiolation protein 1 [Copidosoma floridanum]|uniref:cytoplasmic tRNA 2-thiolation protein 1 n=1 Tax=Copidosoma floridanum TaxID=29053 RepID=UPI0006C9475D|nr:cytoplasmic tRNA 2-thiolation protein 1 [Copidosoma floridanum]
MPVICDVEDCKNPAVLKRPKSGHAMCKECFFLVFELEIHMTIVNAQLFKKGDKVAIGASGGKDSTVLAHVMKLLNERYDYGLDLFLLSIDEGISGYRDDSLETVKQNRDDYQLPLKILSYKDLYGWTMDEIVSQIGNKNNCTFCGTFRRQALDRGAALLGVDMIVTGHNADDMAETVLMNIFRGDYARFSRCTKIITQGEGSIPRCKPLKYAYEKEIVMYAHYKNLVYFSTECKYAPNAYRGYTREYLKQIERIRPTCILDIIYSAEHLVFKENIKLPERRTCTRCGFVASQEICKACVLLEGLNTGNPKLGIGKSNKAKRAMGLKVNDGSENKTKTRIEKGVSKKKLRRDEKRQKQAMMCGGSGNGNCRSGCGSQIPLNMQEESLNSEPTCNNPDHEIITITYFSEWLDERNFDNLVAFKDPKFNSDSEEEKTCDDDCPSKTLISEKKLDPLDEACTSGNQPIALNCNSECTEDDQSTSNKKIGSSSCKSEECCSLPSTSTSNYDDVSDTTIKQEAKKKKCRCPPILLENPNHPEVLVDDEDDDYGINIHVFKSLMIAQYPEIVDEIRQLEEEESKTNSKNMSTEPTSSSEDKNDENIVHKLTSKLEQVVIQKSTMQFNTAEKEMPPNIIKDKSAEFQTSCEQPLEPTVIKANPSRKGASLVTPEMMHKAPNNLDF